MNWQRNCNKEKNEALIAFFCFLLARKPKYFPIKQLFSFYSNCVIPTFGKLISKDKRAYTYLPESVAEFPEGEKFHLIMDKVGYTKVSSLRLSGGISSIYMGYK